MGSEVSAILQTSIRSNTSLNVRKPTIPSLSRPGTFRKEEATCPRAFYRFNTSCEKVCFTVTQLLASAPES